MWFQVLHPPLCVYSAAVAKWSGLSVPVAFENKKTQKPMKTLLLPNQTEALLSGNVSAKTNTLYHGSKHLYKQ